ncbi:MAG: LamG domain-containing protein, partial [Ferruginibacter sp.]
SIEQRMNLKKLIFPAIFAFNLGIQAQNLPSYLPASGLVGWWPFSGNAGDSSVNGNNGTVVNALLTNDRFGKANAAYAFNGVNSRIEIPDAVSLRCRKITISAWIYSNISIPRQVIYKGSINADGEAYSLNSTPGFAFKSGSNCVPAVGWQGLNYKQPISVGTWEHLVATFDGAILKIYRNGLFESSSSIPGLIDSCLGGGLRFGYNHNRYAASTGDGFDGIIDDIGIWNRALTQNEINQVYASSTDCNNSGNLGINVCVPLRSLHVKDVLRLEPRSFSPPNPSKGDIYFDGTTNKLRVYDGTIWRDCW